MNKQLIYSILQYKHSPILGKAINVGVLYYFPGEEKRLYLHITNATRIKHIYKDFNPKYFSSILSLIKNNVVKYSGDLYAEKLLNDNLKEFIHLYLLKNDDTALQFSDLNFVLNIYSNPEKAVEEYTKILIPLTFKNESLNIKYNDSYIIRKFKTRLFKNNKELEDKVEKNYVIKTDEVKIKFDIAWKNGSLNLVHPLSFDLQDAQSIQRKTAEYCSYLTWLNQYTKENNCRVDLLLAKPQDISLQSVYNKSIRLLQEVNSNKKVVPFEEIDSYTDKTLEFLKSV